MTLRIHGRTTSINVQKVMWTIAELGLTHERLDVGGPFGGLDTAEYGKLNPNRLVPVLEDDGFVLWESHAMVRYLANKHGKGSFAPDDPRQHALADQWMEWSNTTLYMDIIATLFVTLHRVPIDQRNPEALKASAARVGEKLAILDEHLAGRAYILGEQVTMADIGPGTLMYRYFSMDIARPSLPNVEAWYARLMARPAYSANVVHDLAKMKMPGC